MTINKKVHILIDEDLKKQLDLEAKEKGLNLSSYIRMILLGRKK